MPNTCRVTTWFFIVFCTGVCPPGAGDDCTLEYRKLNPPNQPWKKPRFGFRVWWPGDEYRCQCLRPQGG